MKNFFKNNKLIIGATHLALSFATFASAQGLVWEGPLQKIKNSIQGPVAMGIGIIAVVVAGLTWAITEGGSMMGKAIKIVAGLAIAFGAATLIANLFGGAKGAMLFM